MTTPSDPRLYDPGPPPLGGAGVAGWVVVLALAAAPGVRIALAALGNDLPPTGAVGAAAAFAAAAVVAAWSLRRQLRSRAPWWIAVMIAPTTLGAAVHEGRLEVLWLATTALALGLVFRTEHVSADRLGEIYEAADRGTGGLGWLRWLLVGALLAAPLAQRPTLLPLFGAGVAAAPGSHGWSPRTAVALGGALGAALGLALAGTGAWQELELNTDLALLWWSAADLAAGRHIGIAVVFFPVLLAILAAERERMRQLLLAGALLSLALDLLLHPYDQWGGSTTTQRITNFSVVPLLPVFWFLTARPRRHNAPPVLAGVAVAGMMLCGPLWLAAWQGAPPEGPTPLLGVAERVRRRLPVETTQRSLQPFAEADSFSDELFLRRMDLGRADPWTLRPESPVTLLVAAPNELPALIVEVEAGGPSQLESRGGEVVQMAFRPDGGTAFQLSPARHRRHRAWWSISPQHFYVLRVVGFGEESAPAGFTLRSGELVPDR